MGQSGILRADQLGLQGMAFGGKVSEQSAETDEIYSASALGQRRGFLTEAADPAEQMGIVTQLGETRQLREMRLEMGEEAMGGHSIVSVGSRESLDAGVKNLLEFLVDRSGGSHKF